LLVHIFFKKQHLAVVNCVILIVYVTRMEERYEIIKGIGSGNFGVAKLVRERQSGKLYAVKIIERGLKVCGLVFNFISLLIYACLSLS